jgi:hypothetical protein
VASSTSSANEANVSAARKQRLAVRRGSIGESSRYVDGDVNFAEEEKSQEILQRIVWIEKAKRAYYSWH